MKTANKDIFELTYSHERLMEALKSLRIATASQLCRALYSPNSVQWVKAMMKELTAHGYAKSGKRPTAEGRRPYYYCLTAKGFRSVSSGDITKRVNISISNIPYFIDHTLELRDVIISAKLLEKDHPFYHLDSFKHDHELKCKPYKAGKLTLIPDAFLKFHYCAPNGKKYLIPIIVEHDRGTERRLAFRQKIRTYKEFFKSGDLAKCFGASRVIVVFTTFAGEKRRDDMRKWTKEELGSNHALYNILFFTSQPQPPEPGMWLEPCWYTIENNPPISLLTR